MKHRYSEKDLEIIKATRKANKDKQVDRRLKALELQATGKRARDLRDNRIPSSIYQSINGKVP